MSLELKFWTNVAELVIACYKDVDFDVLGEDIKVAKSMHEPYSAADVVVWGCIDKTYEARENKEVIQARLLSIKLNSGLFNMVPLSL